jgi:hypothetical protein
MGEVDQVDERGDVAAGRPLGRADVGRGEPDRLGLEVVRIDLRGALGPGDGLVEVALAQAGLGEVDVQVDVGRVEGKRLLPGFDRVRGAAGRAVGVAEHDRGARARRAGLLLAPVRLFAPGDRLVGGAEPAGQAGEHAQRRDSGPRLGDRGAGQGEPGCQWFVEGFGRRVPKRPRDAQDSAGHCGVGHRCGELRAEPGRRGPRLVRGGRRRVGEYGEGARVVAGPGVQVGEGSCGADVHRPVGGEQRLGLFDAAGRLDQLAEEYVGRGESRIVRESAADVVRSVAGVAVHEGDAGQGQFAVRFESRRATALGCVTLVRHRSSRRVDSRPIPMIRLRGVYRP